MNLGDDIPLEPEYKAGKEVIVPFSVIVARENNQGSITSAQVAGRALGSQPAPVVAGDSDLLSALATATNIASNVANTLAGAPRPVRRQRQVLEPEPEPAPAKRVRKRKAPKGVTEVYLGPRKLRSRK